MAKSLLYGTPASGEETDLNIRSILNKSGGPIGLGYL